MQKRRGDKDEKKKKSGEELRKMESGSDPKIQNKHVGGLKRAGVCFILLFPYATVSVHYVLSPHYHNSQ